MNRVYLFQRVLNVITCPLDPTFMDILSRYGQHYEAGLITMYNGNRFYSYQDCQPGYENKTYIRLKQLVLPELLNNLESGTIDPVGYEYKDIQDAACGTSAIETIKYINLVVIYPIPTVSTLFIQSSDKLDCVSLINVLGKRLWTVDSPGSSLRIPDWVIPGMYFIAIQTGGAIVKKKY